MIFLSILSSWTPVLVWAGFIFYLSSIPSLSSGLGVWDTVLRKIAHVAEFAILAGLLLRAFHRTWFTLAKKSLLMWVGCLSVAYAITDEYHQSFVPGRGPSFHDVLIDMVGVGLGLALWFSCRNKYPPVTSV